MKRKQLSEFHKKDISELESELKSLKAKQLAAQVAIVSGKDRNVKDLRNLRRDIAQILTLLSLAASGRQGIIADQKTKEEKS